MADDLSNLDLDVVLDDDAPTIVVDPETGTVEEHNPDGSVNVKLDQGKPGLAGSTEDWYANLVDKVQPLKLAGLTNELIDGIRADDTSRQPSLDMHAAGLELLGIKIKKPSGDVSTTTSGVPGMSQVTNPLLLDSCLRGWANAQAELLPSSGPVKVKEDGDETQVQDERAELLERGMNHYLTTTATEYYPETSQMLLWGTYFKGAGFKKIYRCPMRRRPVSESVDAKDLIVSDASKDLRSCARITHQITMRPSVFRRMQMIGAYRKTSMVQPNPEPNRVDEAIANIQGTAAIPDRPEDKPYTIWETQCELDLDEFIPAGSKFKGERIALPFVVTIDKDNEEILAIRRDWAEDDEHCMRQRMYVRYYYVPGPGFYCTGMLNILGNASAALTAAWREALDAGMFASFPAGLVAKLGGRQNTLEMQLSPGTFQPIETNNLPIDKIAMALPYHDVTPGLMTLIDKITEQSKALGQAPDIPTGEGMQNVPVGTVLANIEQATKVMAAAHKGMHQSQSEEIELLVDLFRRHPQDFLDANPDKDDWTEESLLQALDDVSLVPKSDPNVPSHLHRVAKAWALTQLIAIPDFKVRTNLDEAYRRILNALREDTRGLQIPAPPQQPSEDPAAEAKLIDAQTKREKLNVDMADAASKERQHSDDNVTQRDIHADDLKKEMVIHANDRAKDAAEVALAHRKQTNDEQTALRDHALEATKIGLAAHKQTQDHALGVAEHAVGARSADAKSAVETHKAMNPPKPAGKPTPKGKK